MGALSALGVLVLPCRWRSSAGLAPAGMPGCQPRLVAVLFPPGPAEQRAPPAQPAPSSRFPGFSPPWGTAQPCEGIGSHISSHFLLLLGMFSETSLRLINEAFKRFYIPDIFNGLFLCR